LLFRYSDNHLATFILQAARSDIICCRFASQDTGGIVKEGRRNRKHVAVSLETWWATTARTMDLQHMIWTSLLYKGIRKRTQKDHQRGSARHVALTATLVGIVCFSGTDDRWMTPATIYVSSENYSRLTDWYPIYMERFWPPGSNRDPPNHNNNHLQATEPHRILQLPVLNVRWASFISPAAGCLKNCPTRSQ